MLPLFDTRVTGNGACFLSIITADVSVHSAACNFAGTYFMRSLLIYSSFDGGLTFNY